MSTACQYTIVRFLPFIETGEFANVGVVLFAPKTGFLDFKLAPEAFPRVTQFFDELDRQVYRKAIQGFAKELDEVKALTKNKRDDDLLAFAQEITRLRESLLRFSELRTIVAKDPKATLGELFDRFVGRDFVTKKYREDVMARTIKKQLAKHQLDKQYVTHTFEKDLRKIQLPLVNTHVKNVKAMKPLAFDQKDPSKLIEHAELWRNKLQWLLNRNVLLEENVLLPLEKPKTKKRDMEEAYNIAKDDLEALKVELIEFNNNERIVEFARQGL